MLRQDNEKGEAYQVQLADRQDQSERTVHIGLMDRTKAEIRDGLNLGDRIILPQAQPVESNRRSGGTRRMPRL
jgi:hypothetical protein